MEGGYKGACSEVRSPARFNLAAPSLDRKVNESQCTISFRQRSVNIELPAFPYSYSTCRHCDNESGPKSHMTIIGMSAGFYNGGALADLLSAFFPIHSWSIVQSLDYTVTVDVLSGDADLHVYGPVMDKDMRYQLNPSISEQSQNYAGADTVFLSRQELEGAQAGIYRAEV